MTIESKRCPICGTNFQASLYDAHVVRCKTYDEYAEEYRREMEDGDREAAALNWLGLYGLLFAKLRTARKRRQREAEQAERQAQKMQMILEAERLNARREVS